MENNHVTTLEIDLKAVEHNFNYFKSKLKPNTMVMAVVKAFGYGTGAFEVAKFLESKADYFSVAYFDEGNALRKAGINKPVLVLHPQKNTLKKIIVAQLEPNIYSISILKDIIQLLEAEGIKNYPIHLKFNTGLNRLGFSKKDLSTLTTIINNQQAVFVKSVFSHIAASEDLNERDFTLQQINSFNELTNYFVENTRQKPFKHILNTSGVINFASVAQFDMVRVGIGLYGFGNEDKETEKLKNVITLKSIISQIHTVEKGESVGYNRAYKAPKTIKSATIPIGHADGLTRQFGNGVGYVYIKNQRAPIIGNVCMDMIMVNVTDIDCKEGDEVFVYKNQQHIEALAKGTHTIPYEMLPVISRRIKRVYLS